MDAFAVERNFYKYEEQIKDVFYFYELFILHSLMLRKIFRYAQFRVVHVCLTNLLSNRCEQMFHYTLCISCH